MKRKATAQQRTMTCVKGSRRSTFVGSPLFSSTTAICMYLSRPKRTKIVVR